MTSVATPTRFRLLDARVGWEADLEQTAGVRGYADPYGIRLLNRHETKSSAEVLTPYVPPAWLSPGCRTGEWYLCGSDPSVSAARTPLLRLDPCYPKWFDLRPRLQESHLLLRPVAVDATRRHLAVADEGPANEPARVFVWSLPDGRLIGCTELSSGYVPTAVAFSAWCELLVSVKRDNQQRPAARLLRFDFSGDPHGAIWMHASDSNGKQPVARRPIQRLANGRDGALWAAEGRPEGPFRLWRIIPVEREPDRPHPCDEGPSDPQPVTIGCCTGRQLFRVERIDDLPFYQRAEQELADRFRPTDLVEAAEDRFCLRGPNTSTLAEPRCYDRAGRLLTADMPSKPSPPPRPFEGEFVTQALDSFVPRCRWHRVRLEADVPPEASLRVETATSESDSVFPHEKDWQSSNFNAQDLLIRQPPGRYLYLRLRLTGTAAATPVVHRVQIDFPRVTSLEQLPAVYRENPEAEDFSERFLSLFDAATDDLDRAVERLPALLDAAGLPDEVLPWLGTFLGITFDPAWTPEQRRRLLLEAPHLYRRRGTVEGLVCAVELIFGVRPVVNERVFTRAWGAVGKARVGSVRLFGKSEARFRIGRSALGVAPVRSYGNPDHDPLRSEAHRVDILVPPGPGVERLGRDHLERLIAYQKPAHTLHTLRVGGHGFVLGRSSVVGIDTKLQAPDVPVVGGNQPGDPPGNIRLNRTGILRYGPHGPLRGLQVGRAMVGVNTLLE